MLRDLLEWFELRACILALLVVRFSAIYWLIVLAAKFFTREPLLYLYSPRTYTQETVPVLAVLFVQLVALFYHLLKRAMLGTAAESMVLLTSSPKIAAASTIVLLLWAGSHPAPGASYLPLVALTFVSFVGAIAARKGPLARDAEGLQTTAATHGDSSSAITDSVARISRPTRTFLDIHGHETLKERLLLAAKTVMERPGNSGAHPGRNGILLHGEAGNGKTAFAEALAGELRLPLLTLSYSDVATRWVGEKTSRVRTAFQEAIRNQPCVLFVDEVDSFLESRDSGDPGTVKEDRDLVNALLTLIVDLRQSKVLLVAATNHLDRLDPAAIREGRFDFKIEIPPPDLEARIGLLHAALRSHLPQADVTRDVIEAVARRWNGYSTKRILAIVEELPTILRIAQRKDPRFADFMNALRAVQGHAVSRLEAVRPLSELVLPDRTKRGLQSILTRMADPEHTERHGGTLPTGVLFSGPPGTGKTATAKALAKELGWTFLPTAGAELSRDVGALRRLQAKAQELRPAIIFLDEADELLRHREFSAATEASNKLLTLMDGAGDRVRDVVWIAATNHADKIDPAFLRGGRFSEKVAFELPAGDAVVAHLTGWMRARNVRLEPSFDVAGLVELLGETSIADVEAVAQAALNVAIGRGDTPVILTRQDVLHAIELVLG